MSTRFDIAILLATRGRQEPLMRSLESLVNLAHDVKRMQFMLAFDRDDAVGIDYFVKTVQPWMNQQGLQYHAEVFEPMGYINLHKYNNAMDARTNSDWLVIWNDDAVMQTQDWDSIIASHTGQFQLLAFHTHRDHPYSIFPIVPRAWFDLLGYISPHPTQDGWVSQQAYMLDIWQRIEVDVLHDRYDLTGNNADETFRNRPMLEGKPSDPRDFHSQQMIELRHQDCGKLAAYMVSKGLSIEFFENIFRGLQDPWEKLAKNDVNGQMVQFKNPHSHFSSSK
jgi:hypothetical protein